MTAARGLVRFISQYKFFFISFFLLFFSLPVHDGLGRRVHSFHRSMRSQSLSMPDASTTGVQYSQPRREKEETRKGGRRTSGEEELRWLPGGRWVPSFSLPTPWLAVFPSFPSRLVHTPCTHFDRLVAFQLLLSLLLL